MTTTQPPERAVETVQSLECGLAVIRSFDAGHPKLSLSDVARAAGLALRPRGVSCTRWSG